MEKSKFEMCSCAVRVMNESRLDGVLLINFHLKKKKSVGCGHFDVARLLVRIISVKSGS